MLSCLRSSPLNITRLRRNAESFFVGRAPGLRLKGYRGRDRPGLRRKGTITLRSQHHRFFAASSRFLFTVIVAVASPTCGSDLRTGPVTFAPNRGTVCAIVNLAVGRVGSFLSAAGRTGTKYQSRALDSPGF